MSGVKLGPAHYYPDGGRILIVPHIVREEKEKRWKESRGMAYGEAEIPPSSPAHPILKEVEEKLGGSNSTGFLVGLVDEDDETVHFGLLKTRGESYVLAG